MPGYGPIKLTLERSLAFGDEKRISLTSGGAYLLPAGWLSIVDMGPFLTLEKWSLQRQMWVPAEQQTQQIVPLLYSTGANYRVCNRMNCAMAAVVTNAGSGYTSVPTLSTNRASVNGRTDCKPTFRGYLGGAIQLTISQGGQYDYPPTVVFDYSNQTPPFRPCQLNAVMNSSGAITGFNYDGNDMAGARGSTSGYSGAGLVAANLSVSIVRHPDDTKTSDAAVSIVQAGSGAIVAIDCLTPGGPIGDNDYSNQTSTSGGGGTGLAWSIVGDFYVTGLVVSDGGVYLNPSTVRGTSTGSNSGTTLNDSGKSWTTNEHAGSFVRILDGPAAGEVGLIASNTATALTISQKAPTAAASWTTTPGSAAYEICTGVTSSTANNTYVETLLYDGSLDDEIGRPLSNQGGVGVLTAGVMTSASYSGGGPGFHMRPRVATAPSGPIIEAKRALLTATLGRGGDYFTFQRLAT